MVPALTFLVSLLLSLALVPLVRRLSVHAGLAVPPRPDRWHRRATPALGGAAIFTAFLAAVGGAAWLGNGLGQVRWGLLAGSFAVFLLGLVDDLHPLSPPTKLAGQMLSAAIAVALGYSTHFFTPRLPGNPLANALNLALTFAWLVAITNAFNLLDNMDGLAGGVAVIAAGILGFFFWRLDNQGLLLISLALAGSVLGFLVFNFPPARIFMGDSGSLFLGFTLALLAIARQPQASNLFAVLGVPALLFLLPILDSALVTITRLLRGQSPAQGGRDHASHRLVAFGLNERQAVLALYGVALVSGVLAAVLESLAYWFSLVIVPALVIGLAMLTAYLGRVKLEEGSGERGIGE
jgi:UDP-GlcNAc:undecaprenyl-phosphate GlcNAc-1-phosphate transferase